MTFLTDNFDHHYETLCSMEQAKRNLEDKFKASHLLPPPNGHFIDHDHDDSFDSFESDCESDGEHKRTDPMLDITNTKLPDPPQQPKQTYAFMQKIKSLGSISKQEISKGLSKIRKKSSPKVEKPPPFPEGQQYENTTFYVNDEHRKAPPVPLEASKKEEKKLKKKNSRRATTTAIELPYENHDFHSPQVPSTASPTVLSSISSPILSHTENGTPPPELLSRKKSKSGRSFKSKLRKSFATESSLSIGSSNYGSSRSTFYISDSVDVDSGIFAGNDNKLGTSQEIPTAANSVEKVSDAVLRSPKSMTPDAGRRRSSTARPNNPPPPPPPGSADKQRKKSATSWYAECGVFKTENFNGNHRGSKRNGTSWYTEAGLYQTSGESVISSSGSSGVSTGGEGGPGEDNMHSMFLNEPLYQIYNATRLESISRDIEIVEDHDGYEEVGLHPMNSNEEVKKPQRPSALQLVEPNKGSNRTLWSEVPEVIQSGILGKIFSFSVT